MGKKEKIKKNTGKSTTKGAGKNSGSRKNKKAENVKYGVIKSAGKGETKKSDTKKREEKKTAGKSVKRSAERQVHRSSKQIYTGNLITNRKGFGFVEVEGFEEDIFIPHNMLNGAFHKDTVNVELITGRGRRQEGRIVKVLERGIKEVIGTYREQRGFGFVVPDNQKITDDIHIARKEAHGAQDGQKVVVSILHYGDASHRPTGEITEIIGNTGDPGVDISAIVRGYELPTDFPKAVLSLSEEIPAKVRKKEIKDRRDLRDVKMVTIDGEDTKDLDDAVSLETDNRDYILGVHIADVSHYVKEDDALDKEALERGNSVYLADRVIPMLPERLSNGICSLNAGEDRLAMS